MQNLAEYKDIEQKMAYDGTSIDWFLQKVVNRANSQDLEFGITVNVSGQTISGILVSGKKYFEMICDIFPEDCPDKNQENMNDVFADDDNVEELVFADEANIDELNNDEEQLLPAQYIHLMNASVHSTNGSVSADSGVLWRGKINSVSGFNFGVINTG